MRGWPRRIPCGGTHRSPQRAAGDSGVGSLPDYRPADFRAARTASARVSHLPARTDPARAELYARIDARVDQMIADGLVDEVARLAAAGYDWNLPAMTGLGYRRSASTCGERSPSRRRSC